jgi:hypothetical protein
MILDQDGRPIFSTDRGEIDRRLSPAANQFEGICDIKLYNDAVEIKGKCAYCGGKIEGVLHFPAGYPIHDPDARQDVKQQAMDQVKRQHYCIPRLDGPKLPAKDFLRRFE